MTFAITVSIILAAIVFAAIVGSLTWAIMTSRDDQATAPTSPVAAHRQVGRVQPRQQADPLGRRLVLQQVQQSPQRPMGVGVRVAARERRRGYGE